jgi:hypothetical protein
MMNIYRLYIQKNDKINLLLIQKSTFDDNNGGKKNKKLENYLFFLKIKNKRKKLG